MGRLIKVGTANVSVDLYIIDSTDGTPELGVLWNTAGIDLKYRREGAVVVAITEKALGTPALDDAHDDGGFLEIGNGVYRLDLPDATCAAGATKVVIFGTVTGMIVLPVEIQLVAFDPDDVADLGLTTLTTLLGRVTANVALASVCTEARLAELAAANVPADLDTLLTRITAAVALASVCTEARLAVLADLAAAAGTMVTGAAEVGTLSTTQMTSDLAELTNDHYNGRIVIWTSGVLLGQASDITDYNGADGMLTYTAVTEAPGDGDTFVIV